MLSSRFPSAWPSAELHACGPQGEQKWVAAFLSLLGVGTRGSWEQVDSTGSQDRTGTDAPAYFWMTSSVVPKGALEKRKNRREILNVIAFKSP